jgi:hypothetical protein
MHAGRHQRVADGGQTSVPWRPSRSVKDSVGLAGAEFLGRGDRGPHRRADYPPHASMASLGAAGRYSPLALTTEINGVVLPGAAGDVVVVWSSGKAAGSGPVRPDNSAVARPAFRRRWCTWPHRRDAEGGCSHDA